MPGSATSAPVARDVQHLPAGADEGRSRSATHRAVDAAGAERAAGDEQRRALPDRGRRAPSASGAERRAVERLDLAAQRHADDAAAAERRAAEGDADEGASSARRGGSRARACAFASWMAIGMRARRGRQVGGRRRRSRRSRRRRRRRARAMIAGDVVDRPCGSAPGNAQRVAVRPARERQPWRSSASS